MKTDMEELLNQALAPDEEAGTEINRQIIRDFRKVDTMKNSETTLRKRRLPKAAIAICTLLLVCSATTFAAWKYFSPSDIAKDFNDTALANAFESDTAVTVNETQTFKDYTVTFLGTVSGEALSDFVSESDTANSKLASGKTYAVVAIEKTDGTPMPDTSDADYGDTSFFVSPYIKGENPNLVNIITMNGGYQELVKNGIRYRITECDNVEMFANQGAYLGVTASTFYEPDAYVWNEEEGTLTQNTDYDGVNALFSLPLDKTKADDNAAKDYLDTLLKDLEGDSSDDLEDDDTNLAKDVSETATEDVAKDAEDASSITQEELDKDYTLLTDSVVNTKTDSDGMVNYSYEGKDGFSINLEVPCSELFPDNQPGLSKMYYIFHNDADTYLTVYEQKEDSTITIKTYQKK